MSKTDQLLDLRNASTDLLSDIEEYLTYSNRIDDKIIRLVSDASIAQEKKRLKL